MHALFQKDAHLNKDKFEFNSNVPGIEEYNETTSEPQERPHPNLVQIWIGLAFTGAFHVHK